MYICAGGELADAGATGEGTGGADDGGGRRAAGDDGQQPSLAAVAAGARISVDAELRVLQRHVLRLRRPGGRQLHEMNSRASNSCS